MCDKMVKVSAYTLDEILEKLKKAYGEFLDEEYNKYTTTIKGIKEELQKLVNKYPDDKELEDYYGNFNGFYDDIGKVDKTEEKDKLAWIKSELEHIVHWRKLDMSSGRVLPFKDYRRMKGSTRGR